MLQEICREVALLIARGPATTTPRRMYSNFVQGPSSSSGRKSPVTSRRVAQYLENDVGSFRGGEKQAVSTKSRETVFLMR